MTFVICEAGNVLSTARLPHDGDKVTKKHCEYLEMSPESNLWDFSNAVATGKEHDLTWFNFGDTSVGLLAHELKHAYQFETGSLSLGFLRSGFPLYDKTDEVEAYQRGALFGNPFNGLSSAYDILHEGPMDVKSK